MPARTYQEGDLIIRPYAVYGQVGRYLPDAAINPLDNSRFVTVSAWTPITILEDKSDDWWLRHCPGHRLVRAVTPNQLQPIFILLSDA